MRRSIRAWQRKGYLTRRANPLTDQALVTLGNSELVWLAADCTHGAGSHASPAVLAASPHNRPKAKTSSQPEQRPKGTEIAAPEPLLPKERTEHKDEQRERDDVECDHGPVSRQSQPHQGPANEREGEVGGDACQQT